MFRFAHPEYFYFLLIIPALIILVWVTGIFQTKQLNNFASDKMQKVLIPLRSSVKKSVKSGLLIFSIVLLILSAANPQIGSKVEEVKQVGIDVFILLDVSASMTAEDIKPNRLAKAKLEISKLIQRLQGDRIGLIVFSGEAYVQFPLTTDYSAANLFLSSVDINSVPVQGTSISAAIQLAANSFSFDKETKKAIVVITDGEDHEGELESVVEEASGKGIQIYAIGMGTPIGEPIPVYNSSGVKTGYKKDNQGNTVLTKLDEETLKRITEMGKGGYYRSTNNENELNKIFNDLSELEETEFGATRITDYEDRYYYFLIPALIILFMELFISQKKSKFFMNLEK